MRDARCLASCDSSRSVQCKPARRLKGEAAHILRNRENGCRYALSCGLDKIARTLAFSREMNGDRESFAQSGVSRFGEDRLLSLAERNEAVHIGPQKADDCFLACRNKI